MLVWIVIVGKEKAHNFVKIETDLNDNLKKKSRYKQA